MPVYEGTIKLRLFYHAPISLFAHSYRLFHLKSVQLLAQFEFNIVFPTIK